MIVFYCGYHQLDVRIPLFHGHSQVSSGPLFAADRIGVAIPGRRSPKQPVSSMAPIRFRLQAVYAFQPIRSLSFPGLPFGLEPNLSSSVRAQPADARRRFALLAHSQLSGPCVVRLCLALQTRLVNLPVSRVGRNTTALLIGSIALLCLLTHNAPVPGHHALVAVRLC
jgi:hypothetical protein